MADYISQFTGSEIDQRLAKVPQLESGKQDNLVSGSNIKTINGQSVLGSGDMQIQAGDTDAVKYVAQTLTDAQKAQARTNIAAASAAELGQIVTDLTGIEADIDSLEAAVQAIGVGDFVTATTLPTASASTMGHIYLIGPDANNNYDRYFTQESSGSYSWVPLGSTQIDLSTYATQAEVDQLEAKVDDIYSDKTVPDVYTFDGVDDAISFDVITLAVDGDAFEFEVMANGTGATKGMAFGTNNGNRTIEVAESCLALGYGNGSWVTGMNGGSGLLNLATLNKKLTQRRKILLLRDSGDIKVYIDGELIHSEALSNTVTLSKIGGPYSTKYWLGVLYSFRYIHGGVTKEIYELPGYSVSGNIAYTTKRIASGVLEETIEAVDALDERVEGTENGLTDLEGETFAEQEVTTTIDVSDIPGVVKMAGYNAGPNSSTEIAFNALSGYDSYYFYPSSPLSAWLTDPGVTYIALSVIENAQPFNNNSIYGTNAARYRKSDSDLPSANSPLSIPSGSAVIVTVTAGAMVGFATKSNITTFNGNTPLAEEHIEQVLDAIEENGEGEPMYVAKNAGKLDVYLRIPNGKYIRYPFVKRYKAYTENEYPSFYDNWGIGVPALAEFSGSMADVAPLFLSGEAELAVSVPSGRDGETPTYVGGQAHGFENIVTGSNGREICILVDNQKVAEDAVLSLVPASKVDIIQHTQICQAYTNTNPFADVTKHWVWENGKMSCTTSVKILRSILFSYAQFGMMCVYRRWLGDVNNDYLTNSAIKNDNPFKVWDVSDGWSGMLQSPDKDCTRIVEYGQKGLGFSMSIKSETIKSNGGMFVATNGLAYNKIYFDMGRSFTPSVNDVLEGTQTWEILG